MKKIKTDKPVKVKAPKVVEEIVEEAPAPVRQRRSKNTIPEIVAWLDSKVGQWFSPKDVLEAFPDLNYGTVASGLYRALRDDLIKRHPEAALYTSLNSADDTMPTEIPPSRGRKPKPLDEIVEPAEEAPAAPKPRAKRTPVASVEEAPVEDAVELVDEDRAIPTWPEDPTVELLAVIFPNGVPVKLIPYAVAWQNQTRDLMNKAAQG